MITRDALNYLGQKIGEVSFPDGTSEDVIAKKLAPYAVAPVSQEEMVQKSLMKNIKQRKEYADDLLERFKAKNISEGINALQAMKLHEKMAELHYVFMGQSMKADILNMAVSGDIETAILALMNTTDLDDGSAPYHWLNEARRDWLVADMKAYLGWS
jgi:hypothetical protein